MRRKKGEERRLETLFEEIGLNSSFECSDVFAVSNTVRERVPKLRAIDRERAEAMFLTVVPDFLKFSCVRERTEFFGIRSDFTEGKNV